MEKYFKILAFYEFIYIANQHKLADEIKYFCENNNIRGVIIIAPEGINLTVAGLPLSISSFENFIKSRNIKNYHPKYASSDIMPFYRLKIKIKNEIITMLDRAIDVDSERGVLVDPADWNQIIIDPGIGFGKTSVHNFTLLNNLNIFVSSGYSVLLGASRKRFMGDICNVDTPSELIGATTATTVLGVPAGVKIFRVHDVKENRQAADTAWAILNR